MGRIVVAIVLLVAAAALRAQEPAGPSDPHELAAFLDGVMEAQQKAHHFAGAVVVVVKNGQVLFEQGYGYSDYAARAPVDPKRTLFRVASNSKMFVWTAVMQLVEQGKLDLHTDVNQYLHGVQIPRTFPEPITLAHLMTHTAGFEDLVSGLFAKTPDKMRPLAEVIRTSMPARVFPPGKVTAYSNYGSALAAMIVEQVSGVPFEQYLKEHILDPLGMEHATLTQPLPANLAPDLSKGYRWSVGRFQEEPFEYVPLAPCGGMSIAGDDMGRFMIAQLRDGAGILRPETARLMRERLISFSPDVPGMLHGFMGFEPNTIQAFGHGGDTVWFHSMTVMVPSRDVGYFIAYNTDDGSAARSEFTQVFFDHYFPLPLPKEIPPPKDAAAKLQRFAGTYFAARNSLSDFTKLNLLINAINLSVNPEGYLMMFGRRWRQVQPLLFAEVDGRRRLAFREDERGNIVDACASPVCTSVLLKQSNWIAGVFGRELGQACLGIFVIALVGLPIAAAAQRKQAKPFGAKLARFMAWCVCAIFVVGAIVLLVTLDAIQDDVVFGAPKIVARLVIPLWTFGAGFSLALPVLSVSAWRQGWWRMPGRICFTLVSVAAIACALWLYHWNLLGVQ